MNGSVMEIRDTVADVMRMHGVVRASIYSVLLAGLAFSAVAVDRDGNIALFDPLANELRIFPPDGTPQRSIGRAGQGPGEFQNVLGLSYGPDGDLWIVDGRNRRYTVLRRDAELEDFPRTRILFGGDTAMVLSRELEQEG